MKEVPDYYAVLGVLPDATIQQIRQAFRTRARECHPDRNPGRPDASDEMRSVLEAWDILSDASRRARYDHSRKEPNDQSAVVAYRADQAEAQAAAKSYPRRWTDFESWQRRLLNDFVATSYGDAINGCLGFGERQGSLTSMVFGMGGGLIATVLAFPFMNRFAGTSSGGGVFDWIGNHVLVLLPPYVGGVALGLLFHLMVRAIISGRPTTRVDRDMPSSIIGCSTCGQRVRLPRVNGRVRITCPKCRSEFYRTVGA